MNPAHIYRKNMVAAPAHTLLAKLHEQAGIFTQQVAQFAREGNIEIARKHIQYVQDIITFLRSSLDMTLEASQRSDAVYAYYYNVLVKWYLNVERIPDEFDVMLEFWQSWAATWTKVPSHSLP